MVSAPPSRINWRYGLLAIAALILLSIIPQARLCLERGRKWQGSFAAIQGDEWAYSAYVNALINGRPRRNDPFAGKSDLPGSPQPESIFSIQFIPAYAVSIPARLLGISASTAFICLIAVSAVGSTVAIFWLLVSITEDGKTAAAGVLFVLCFGALVCGQGVSGILLGEDFHSGYLPFLRRYEPAVSFPLLFIFCALVWRAFTAGEDQRLRYSAGAGAVLAVLLFSYFYLWTAGAAWLGCFALLWLLVRCEWRKCLRVCVGVGIPFLIALPFYLNLVMNRDENVDGIVVLTMTRMPDLFRHTEILGAVELILLGLSWRRHWITTNNPTGLLVAACALTPFAVFNQQILTGRSLQPFHYEVFAVNYLLLIGAVVLFYLLRRATKTYPAMLRALVLISLAWGIVEISALELSVQRNPLIDEAAAVGRRLSALASSDRELGCVLSTDSDVANVLPTFAPQALLWSQHHPVYYTSRTEHVERFYQYLYFTGYDGPRLARTLQDREAGKRNYIIFRTTLFGHQRQFPYLGQHLEPIQQKDLDHAVEQYLAYVARFSPAEASRFPLSYLVMPVVDQPDLSNLVRYYERNGGERVGEFMLYRLRLK